MTMSHHPGITPLGFMLLIVLLVLQRPATEAQREGERPREEDVLREHAYGICTAVGLETFRSVGDDDEIHFCCKCSPGEYLVELCPPGNEGDPHPRCSPCPFEENNPDQQFWMDKQNNSTSCFRTLPQNSCDVFMNTNWQMGSRTTNARCVCKDGYHSASHNEEVSGGCHLHSPCDIGFQPSTLGDATTDTHCQVCLNGTFSNVPSAVNFCVDWTQCESNVEIIFEGNRTHDRVCSVIVEIDNGTSPDNLQINGSDSTPTDSNTSALSGGVIAGIVLVPLIAIAVIVVVWWFCCRKPRFARLHRKWCKSSNSREKEPDEGIMLNPVDQADEMRNGGTGDPRSRQAPQRVAMPTHADRSNGNGGNGETSGNGLSNDVGHGDMQTSRNGSIDGGGTGAASTSDRDSQDIEKGQKQGKEDSSSPSDDNKALEENARVSKDESDFKLTDETEERSQSGHVSEGPSAHNQANPPGVIMAPNPAPLQQDNPPPQPTNPAAQQLDKERFLEILPNFRVEMDLTEQNGCRNCCFEKRLEDSEIGKRMLQQLVELITDVILPFIRLYLSETDIDDIKNNNVGKEREIRYKLILKIQCNQGRDLTPARLLAEAASIRVNQIRDEMIKEFFNGFAPCHQV